MSFFVNAMATKGMSTLSTRSKLDAVAFLAFNKKVGSSS